MDKQKIKGSLLAAALILASLLLMGGILHSQPDYVPQAAQVQTDSNRSRVYVTGTGYQRNTDRQEAEEDSEGQSQDPPQPEQTVLPLQKPEQKPQIKLPKSQGQKKTENKTGKKKAANQTGQKPLTDTGLPVKKADDQAKPDAGQAKDTGDQAINDAPEPSEASYPSGEEPAPDPEAPQSLKDREGEEADQSQEEKEAKPRITTSLRDGDEKAGAKLKFWVTASDAAGRSIPVFSVEDGSVEVFINDQAISSESESGNKIYYRPELVDGKNKIRILATDRKGLTSTLTRTITAFTEAEAEKIGQVQVTISARILGLGTIFQTTVEIEEGDNAKDALSQAFAQAGIEGTFTKGGSYLAGIKKSGIAAGWSIDEDVRAALEERRATELDPADQSDNSLKEHDFYNTSGWIYAVNGQMPDVGLMGCELHDGDELVLYFQLDTGIY